MGEVVYLGFGSFICGIHWVGYVVSNILMRIYSKGKKNYISVTSIIDMMYGFDNEGFENWALSQNIDPKWITEHSASLGTKYHEYFENKFYGISDWADVVDDVDEGYRRAVDHLYGLGWEIVKSEQEVYCDEFGFAGRFDMLVKNDRLNIKKAIADVKTWGAWSGKPFRRDLKKLKKVEDQLSMYRYALGEEIPMYLFIPQKNGECIVEGIAYVERWKDFIKNNQKEILDMTEGMV